MSALASQIVAVGTPGAVDAYEVRVGGRTLEALAPLLRSGRRVLIVAQPGRDALVDQVSALIERADGLPFVAWVPDAEASKDVMVLAGLWRQMGQADFTRDDLVVGIGGGAATDLAGFAAATWLRGIDVVHLPTSLLGVVDASVGGKTGINTGEGKNLVGAFYAPKAVLCDPAWLASMGTEDYVSGLAEVIKCGFIADPMILDLIEADALTATKADAPVTVELIRRAVQVKATVVTADPKESSLREILNFGHTLAHAIELIEDYTWRHGDAVAVGMVFAAELGVLAGRTPPELLTRLRAVLKAVGLPTSYPGGRWDELRAAMARDKKSRGATLRFVVLDDLATPGRLVGPTEDDLRTAYSRINNEPANRAQEKQ